VRPCLRRLHLLDLELDPIALFEMMNAPVEGQQKFERVVGRALGYIISGDDMYNGPSSLSRSGCGEESVVS
jgi:hypothetical protein